MAIAGGRAGLGAPLYTPVGDVANLTANTLLRINPPCTFSIPLPPTNDGTTSRADIRVRWTASTYRRIRTTNGWGLRRPA